VERVYDTVQALLDRFPAVGTLLDLTLARCMPTAVASAPICETNRIECFHQCSYANWCGQNPNNERRLYRYYSGGPSGCYNYTLSVVSAGTMLCI
jgi:hypothetical protein